MEARKHAVKSLIALEKGANAQVSSDMKKDSVTGSSIAGLEESASASSPLAAAVCAGLAFHHAGLTAEERDIVESCYRKGIISVLAGLYMHTHTYIHTYLHTYIHIYTYIHTHTYINMNEDNLLYTIYILKLAETFVYISLESECSLFFHVILIFVVATSTLAAGVNLPAGCVLIRSLNIGKELLNVVQYRQMCGRAGRAGLSNCGESYLLVKAMERDRLGSPPLVLI
jgi:replicative superfamily II helicase